MQFPWTKIIISSTKMRVSNIRSIGINNFIELADYIKLMDNNKN